MWGPFSWEEGGGAGGRQIIWDPQGLRWPHFPLVWTTTRCFAQGTTPPTGNFGSHTDKYTILGTGLNIKSCLRILIWTPEVPSFWSWRWTLLPKISLCRPKRCTTGAQIKIVRQLFQYILDYGMYESWIFVCHCGQVSILMGLGLF